MGSGGIFAAPGHRFNLWLNSRLKGSGAATAAVAPQLWLSFDLIPSLETPYAEKEKKKAQKKKSSNCNSIGLMLILNPHHFLKLVEDIFTQTNGMSSLIKRNLQA